jgi:uncharacterized protein YkwD
MLQHSRSSGWNDGSRPPTNTRPSRALLLALTVAVTVLTACDAAPFDPQLPPDSHAAARMATLVNEHRDSVGCPALSWHPVAADVAHAHSADMVERQFFGHVNPDGVGPFSRLGRAGVSYRSAGENLARGWSEGREEEVLRAWLASDSHRRVLEDCRYTHHGIGLETGHWTHVLIG